MEPSVFESIAEEVINNSHLKEVLNENDEVTQAHVRDLLLHSEQFQTFLLEHGAEALQIIEKEYADEIALSEAHATTGSPGLFEGLTIQGLHQAYQQLMDDLNELEEDEQEEQEEVFGYGL